MEEKERTKYHPISLKDKTLRDEFNILGIRLGSENADKTMEYLLYQDKISQNMSMSSLERLGKLTRTNETWDDLINRILDEREDANKKIRELEEKLKELE